MFLFVEQVDAKTIFERYGVARYVTQQLQEQAGKHAGMMAAFCERMGWADLEILIAKFQVRLQAPAVLAATTLLVVESSSIKLVGFWPAHVRVFPFLLSTSVCWPHEH
jgi:DNA polymerase theta